MVEIKHGYSTNMLRNWQTNIMEQKIYTVWVGGIEVNNYLLTKEEADYLANEYRDVGHDDVVVESVEKSTN